MGHCNRRFRPFLPVHAGGQIARRRRPQWDPTRMRFHTQIPKDVAVEPEGVRFESWSRAHRLIRLHHKNHSLRASQGTLSLDPERWYRIDDNGGWRGRQLQRED
ncbi:hypothetical protein EVAR_5671_1 [Eumeta japonica]|uniref:Uncharacterized protein n=1 Tax=Eumeta variegata TaxID=151549 RepID=A0A4C1T9W9_EUMVA|nr:hypothetical protein EVAR_5671_1 [Eumeta japonica]